jgi:3-oxoacyl-(acyl-carrier-protein) synthase
MIYINGAASISPQSWTSYTNFNERQNNYSEKLLVALKPNYKDFIKPMQARRMSKTVKNSIVAASMAMDQAQITSPEAIITGSGLGVVGDTQDFLEKMLDNNEQFLTPTSFIQSTHNTPAAHIAARISCHAYNYTYVNRGHSFENAMQDALMHLAEGKKQILAGGSDEMTEQYFFITQKAGWWKKEAVDSDQIFRSETQGAICGEGTHFFVLSKEKSELTQSALIDIETFYKPQSQEDIKNRINAFLDKNQIKSEDIDLVLLGNSGDFESDKVYKDLQDTFFTNNALAGFKHLCGEYHTASAFALWLANAVLKTQTFPSFIRLNNKEPKHLKKILIYNHYFNINHSLMLVSKS